METQQITSELEKPKKKSNKVIKIVGVVFVALFGLVLLGSNSKPAQSVLPSPSPVAVMASPIPLDSPIVDATPSAVPSPSPIIVIQPRQVVASPVIVTPIAQPSPDTVQSAPATDQHVGATALCNDGTYSYSAHHQGTCSHHGGVNQFYN